MELFKQLWEVWKEMFTFTRELAWKVFVFMLWVFSGILILPCVFIASTFYPKWTEWSEKI